LIFEILYLEFLISAFDTQTTSPYLIQHKSINPLHLDTITLKSLEFYGKHGYYDEERREGNHFELDVIAKGNFIAAIEDDDLNQTFNYEIVKEVAQRVFKGPSEKLIESLCSRIGNEIFERSTITKELTISLRKLNPPIGVPAEYAEITMKWNR